MAGIEVIGALASISQLLDYGLKIASSIAETYKRIEGAQGRLQRYNSQIRQLTDIALLIQQNKELHISVVCVQVDLTVTQARALLHTIQTATTDYTKGSRNKRYWKATRGSKEKQISLGFERLEQEKSSLLLCISVVNADIISTISSNVNSMNANVTTLMAESKDSNTKFLLKRTVEQKATYLPGDKNWVDRIGEECDEDDDNTRALAVFIEGTLKGTIKNSARASNSASSKENVTVFHNTYNGMRTAEKGQAVYGMMMSNEVSNNRYENISTLSGARAVTGNVPNPEGNGEVVKEGTGGSGRHSSINIECIGKGSWHVAGNLGKGVTMSKVNSFFDAC